MSEQRKYKRALLISYLNTYDYTSNSETGFLADISHGGMLLISKNPIPVDVSLSLAIEVPEEVDETETFVVTAKSIRCIKDKDLNYFNTGFIFEEMTSNDIQIVNNIMAAFEL
ncbi:PilZ domain-containing protein [bacterium]|nr:PilZ domain-containing protein [bacterium]